jgi:outer membrane protein, heavy metal efflux system
MRLLIALATLASFSVNAQTDALPAAQVKAQQDATKTIGLTEERVRESVLQHFPLLEEAAAKVEATRNEIIAAQGDFDTKVKFKSNNNYEDYYESKYIESSVEKMLPVGGLTIYGGHRQGRGTFATYEQKMNTSTAGEVFAGLVLPILRNRAVDRVRLNNEFARIDNEIARRELLVKKNMYIHKGLSVYQKWKFSYLKLQTIRGLLKIAEDRHDMLERMYRAGNVEQIKVTDNLRSINKRKDELVKGQMEFEAISAELSLFLRDAQGNPMDPAKLVPASLGYQPRPLVPQIRLDTLPQLNILDMMIERNRQLNEFYENQALPALNVEALAARELAPNSPRLTQDRMAIGLGFEYPLENRKARGGSVATSYKRIALEKQRFWLGNEFGANFDRTQMIVRQASERTRLTSQELEFAKTLAEAERRRWRQGDSDLFIVALREQDAADVEVRLWGAHYEYEQANLDAQLFSAAFIRE